MPEDHPHQLSPEIIRMTQRLFHLRTRFRIGMPENIAMLKSHIREAGQDGKPGGVSDFDTFYNVGTVFSRHTGPMSMGELSHELDTPLSSATRIMDWFVKNGYAHRLPDPQDRRIVRVELTTAGLEVYRTIQERFMGSIERIMQHLDPDERKTFTALLMKVLDAVEKES